MLSRELLYVQARAKVASTVFEYEIIIITRPRKLRCVDVAHSPSRAHCMCWKMISILGGS